MSVFNLFLCFTAFTILLMVAGWWLYFRLKGSESQEEGNAR